MRNIPTYNSERLLQKILKATGAIHKDTFSLEDNPPGDFHRELEKIVSGYTILEEIRKEKFGIVYKAKQNFMDRIVAIKILDDSLAQDPVSYFQHCLREIRYLGKLNHPNLIKGLDSGEKNGIYYLVMEHYEGINLEQYVKARGKLHELEALKITQKLLSALTEIWKQNLVHRDICPENIIVCDGDIKISNFGLLKAISYDEHISPTTYSFSSDSFKYMSPEQIQGKNLQYQSDIFSIGATLYFSLTGKTISEKNLEQYLLFEEEIISPRKYDHEISKETEKLVQTMLKISPEKRSNTKRESLEEINRVIDVLEKREAQGKIRSILYEYMEAIGLIIGVALLFFISFHSISKNNIPKGSTMSPSIIYNKYSSSVVLIETRTQIGSGVIIKYKNIYSILTNAHVIEDEAEVKIILKNGKSFVGKVYCNDIMSDLALITLPDTIGQLSEIPFGNIKTTRVGEDVIVIGHPKGYKWSLSRGTVSAIRENTIQTDAAINKGNSGGPLLNMRGEMIGITTFVIEKSNAIGFAISINKIKGFLSTLFDK